MDLQTPNQKGYQNSNLSPYTYVEFANQRNRYNHNEEVGDDIREGYGAIGRHDVPTGPIDGLIPFEGIWPTVDERKNETGEEKHD